jgi:hypothetical protein
MESHTREKKFGLNYTHRTSTKKLSLPLLQECARERRFNDIYSIPNYRTIIPEF